MAERPIFLTDTGGTLVSEVPVPMRWHAGFSSVQKKKNIAELHRMAKYRLAGISPLEVSTKSELGLGRKLSAFNLQLTLPDGRYTTVESAYQGSKVFQRGGPFTDLYNASPVEAKRDARLSTNGAITHFDFFGEIWDLQPKTAFYDWLYISALSRSRLGDDLMAYSGFTDIEFNPKKSVNCQARAVAMYVSLMKRDGVVDLTPQGFRQYYQPQDSEPQQAAML